MNRFNTARELRKRGQLDEEVSLNIAASLHSHQNTRHSQSSTQHQVATAEFLAQASLLKLERGVPSSDSLQTPASGDSRSRSSLPGVEEFLDSVPSGLDLPWKNVSEGISTDLMDFSIDSA